MLKSLNIKEFVLLFSCLFTVTIVTAPAYAKKDSSKKQMKKEKASSSEESSEAKTVAGFQKTSSKDGWDIGEYKPKGKETKIAALRDPKTDLVWAKDLPKTLKSFDQARRYCDLLEPAGSWQLPTLEQYIVGDFHGLRKHVVNPTTMSAREADEEDVRPRPDLSWTLTEESSNVRLYKGDAPPNKEYTPSETAGPDEIKAQARCVLVDEFE